MLLCLNLDVESRVQISIGVYVVRYVPKIRLFNTEQQNKAEKGPWGNLIIT